MAEEIKELKELEEEELKLFDPSICGFSEFDAGELNKINKKKLQILKKRWGRVYIYMINRSLYSDWIVKEYEGWDSVDNWFDFALPFVDDKIVSEIEIWRATKRPTMNMIEHIYNRAEALGAVFFSWA